MSITETIQAVRADLAGLTAFSPLRDHPLLAAFAALLDEAAAMPGSAVVVPGKLLTSFLNIPRTIATVYHFFYK
jgi:hypothetical protein